MHAQVHRSLGSTVVEFDAADPPLSPAVLRRVPWDEAIMDICTPTSVHTKSLAWGYARGVRRFMVEKPAAASLAAWRAQLAVMPHAQIFVMHPYLFSQSLRIALDAVPDITEITIAFNKDRTLDDERRRGAAFDGRLPHLFHVEAPHQFAIALAVAPGLRVSDAAFEAHAARGSEPYAPVAATVTLEDSLVTRVVLTTNLRSPRRRVLRLRNSDGGCAVVRFPTTADLAARAFALDRQGRRRVLFGGSDDLLSHTMARAVESLQSATVPLEASARFAGTVLARIDDACLLAERRQAAVPAPDELMAEAVCPV
jgi:hypothetical protein